MFPLLSVAVLVPVPAQYETYSEVAWCGHHVHDPPKLKATRPAVQQPRRAGCFVSSWTQPPAESERRLLRPREMLRRANRQSRHFRVALSRCRFIPERSLRPLPPVVIDSWNISLFSEMG
ncbi:hypothetical protein BJX66DRAFT_92782 [Aspergillus keveii]|uniref:Secreted protein n=1 Tax=Aspergillus keveii TaxID=714993 RepID=A0ABR4GEH0_9EURO